VSRPVSLGLFVLVLLCLLLPSTRMTWNRAEARGFRPAEVRSGQEAVAHQVATKDKAPMLRGTT